MVVTTNELRLAGIESFEEPCEDGDSILDARSIRLSEVPGVVIGLITIFYLISSLLTLVH